MKPIKALAETLNGEIDYHWDDPNGYQFQTVPQRRQDKFLSIYVDKSRNEDGQIIPVVIRAAQDEVKRRHAENVLVGWIKCCIPADVTSDELNEVVAAIQVLAEVE